jgi:hypothetical protein
MSAITSLDDTRYQPMLRPLWDYLAVEHTPKKSDVIFVFGGLDLAIPLKAAELYGLGLAPLILISGGAGIPTENVSQELESSVFRKEITKLGVPPTAIVEESKASNTRENVMWGMEALISKNIKVDSAILVAKPFLLRRCLATFQLQYPEVILFSCPPEGPILKFCDRPQDEFAERLLAELERLKLYAERGHIVHQSIPQSVQSAAAHLRTLLPKNPLG